MKRKGVMAAAISILLTLAGCGSQGSDASGHKPDPGGAKTAQTTPTKKGPTINSRGDIVKHVNEKAGAFAADGKTEVANWTVTGITKDFACTKPNPQASMQGHFVALDATVNTTSALKGDFGFGNGSTWQYVKKDGSVWNEDPESIPSANCVPDADHLPANMGPGLKATGKIIFDLPDTDGYLVFPYTGEDGLRTTWEYPLQ